MYHGTVRNFIDRTVAITRGVIFGSSQNGCRWKCLEENIPNKPVSQIGLYERNNVIHNDLKNDNIEDYIQKLSRNFFSQIKSDCNPIILRPK
ncbi:hypothetical protein AVEN_112372-1 [Araneus ventricosus]|uniref:Uncharacterized protein n=1 Tax=Araneus ventricosus TaxID=182803 RepID=A0A4Y2SYS9_ARAVE|nr:hypothetical protein AVEN_112372-1 [Araneus ventricosus]